MKNSLLESEKMKITKIVIKSKQINWNLTRYSHTYLFCHIRQFKTAATINEFFGERV